MTGASESRDDDSDASVGGRTAVEGKKILTSDDYDQVTAIAVVMSFIHKTRHSGGNHLTPAICMAADTGQFFAALYDSDLDLLLFMSPLCWFEGEGETASLVETTIVLVWLFLNHRLFLRKLKPHPQKYQSGLRRVLREGGALQRFESLRSLNVATWPRATDWLPVNQKNVEEFKPPCEESEESEG